MNASKLFPWMPLMFMQGALHQFCHRFLKWHRTGLALAESSADASAPADPADPDPDDDAPRACGWFDSSHDLHQGLCVQEHLSTETLARELPLGAWLELQLSGWRAAAPAAPAVHTHAA